MIRDNAGFLVCLAAPICRSGWQDYRVGEISPESNDDSVVSVYRPPREVTSAGTIASAQGKPVTDKHPARLLTPEMWSWAARGHAQNVRVGPEDRNGDVTLVADLHIQDASLIERILGGVRDLSCGYTYDLEQQRDGSYAMRNIRINHVAVVEQGRAGTTYIQDARSTMPKESQDDKIDRIIAGLEALLERLESAPRSAHARTAVDERRKNEAQQFEMAAGRYHRRSYHIRSDKEETSQPHSKSALDEFTHQLRVEVDPDRAWEAAIRRAGARMRDEKR